VGKWKTGICNHELHKLKTFSHTCLPAGREGHTCPPSLLVGSRRGITQNKAYSKRQKQETTEQHGMTRKNLCHKNTKSRKTQKKTRECNEGKMGKRENRNLQCSISFIVFIPTSPFLHVSFCEKRKKRTNRISTKEKGCTLRSSGVRLSESKMKIWSALTPPYVWRE
jgi:hypothetical protein